MKIIDCHTHIFSPDIIENRNKYLTDLSFSLLYSRPEARIITGDELLADMDEAGIEYSVALGFPWGARKFIDEHNDYLARVNKSSGGRIIPFASVPHYSGGELEAWFNSLPSLGFRGVGEIAFYGDSIRNADWSRLDTIISLCESNSLIAMIHVNEPVGHNYPGKYLTDFGELVNVISSHASAIIILAHLGGGILFYELMPEIKKSFSKVYYDTAASPYIYNDEVYSAAMKLAGPDKILFGSDYPLIKPRKYIDSIHRTLESSDAEKILFRNAERILF